MTITCCTRFCRFSGAAASLQIESTPASCNVASSSGSSTVKRAVIPATFMQLRAVKETNITTNGYCKGLQLLFFKPLGIAKEPTMHMLAIRREHRHGLMIVYLLLHACLEYKCMYSGSTSW